MGKIFNICMQSLSMVICFIEDKYFEYSMERWVGFSLVEIHYYSMRWYNMAQLVVGKICVLVDIKGGGVCKNNDAYECRTPMQIWSIMYINYCVQLFDGMIDI